MKKKPAKKNPRPKKIVSEVVSPSYMAVNRLCDILIDSREQLLERLTTSTQAYVLAMHKADKATANLGTLLVEEFQADTQEIVETIKELGAKLNDGRSSEHVGELARVLNGHMAPLMNFMERVNKATAPKQNRLVFQPGNNLANTNVNIPCNCMCGWSGSLGDCLISGSGWLSCPCCRVN